MKKVSWALGKQRQADLCEFEPGLQSEFQDSEYTEKPCLEKQQQQPQKIMKEVPLM